MDIKGFIKSVSRSPLYGNEMYGKNFDDSTQCANAAFPFPVSIIVQKGDIIDNLGFGYEKFTLKHGGSGGTKKENRLNADEHIIKVEGNYEKYGKEVVMKSLSFTTDKGRTFNYGTVTNGQGYFKYEASPGFAICALHGQEGRFLGAVGFCARKIQL